MSELQNYIMELYYKSSISHVNMFVKLYANQYSAVQTNFIVISFN